MCKCGGHQFSDFQSRSLADGVSAVGQRVFIVLPCREKFHSESKVQDTIEQPRVGVLCDEVSARIGDDRVPQHALKIFMLTT